MYRELDSFNKSKKRAGFKIKNFNKSLKFYKKNTKKQCSLINQNFNSKKSNWKTNRKD